VSAKQAGAQTQGHEVSARKRQRYVRHYRGGGNAAALQTFGAIAGTIGGIVAADQARRAYRNSYNPYYAPYGYGYQPYAYQPQGYYGGYYD